MYKVFDLETTIKKAYGRLGNPWFNSIVAVGTKTPLKSPQTVMTNTLPYSFFNDIYKLIGHNLKFDLLYIWKDSQTQTFFKNGGTIHDTALAEYILSGQQHKYPALRDIAVNKYGCQYREKFMEAYWEKGIDTDQIPTNLVLSDVCSDVADTESIYLQQLTKLQENNQLKLIELQMDALLATTEMEYNGMYVDKEILLKNKFELEQELANLKQEFLDIMSTYWIDYKLPEFNINSGDHLSGLFFNTEIKVEYSIENGVTKAGKQKYKKIKDKVKITGFGLKPLKEWKNKKGLYSTDEEVLKIISNYSGTNKENIKAKNCSDILLKIRGAAKQLNTYYDNILELIYDDSCLHPSFVHVETPTGRLSCKNPNAQNQPKNFESKVKQHFTSRFLGGKIVEIDWSQLEIRVQAELCKDENYTKDLLNGVDFHSKRLALLDNKSYGFITEQVKIGNIEYIQKRSKVKSFSFARSYGAGVKHLSESTGLTVDEVKTLIHKEQLAYPKIELYVNMLHEYVKHTAATEGVGYYTGPTERKYVFQLDTPSWSDKPLFPLTKIRNYNVQGTATADIVLIMLGKFWREKAIYNRDKYLMINTVHDSILFDCKAEYIDDLLNDLKMLDKAPGMMYNEFKVNWKIPLPIDVKIGNSWWDC